MAAGEYVSVSSQTDAEQADLARERAELETVPESELETLRELVVHEMQTALPLNVPVLVETGHGKNWNEC